MKRTFIILVTLTLLTALASSLFACKQDVPVETRTGLEKNVSVYHDAAYVGANEDFSAQLFTGETEKLIVVDGKVGELTRFATLTVTPLSASLFNNTYTYLLKGENGEKTGVLEKDVIGAAFSAELTDLTDLGKITEVSVVAEGILDSPIPLVNKLDNALGWREILKVAESELSENIQAENDNGVLLREIYIKLVNALPDEEAPYYYYVSFIKSPADYWALLLDPADGKVVSKKI